MEHQFGSHLDDNYCKCVKEADEFSHWAEMHVIVDLIVWNVLDGHVGNESIVFVSPLFCDGFSYGYTKGYFRYLCEIDG